MDSFRTLQHKNFEIEVNYDTDAENPFLNWDGSVPLIAQDRETHDYSKGDIDTYLLSFLSDENISKNEDKISLMIEESFDEQEDKIEVIYEAVTEWMVGNKQRELFCSLFGIKHYRNTSIGYSQGESVNCFLCWSPEFGKATGVTYEDFDEVFMVEAFKLFGYWAWGDVYSVNCSEIEYHVGGFYGEDDVEAAITEVKGIIDSRLKLSVESKESKLKDMIKAKVPLLYRERVLSKFVRHEDK